jgi:hypothetical protein
MSPSFTLSALTHSSSASGMDAADVFPYLAMLDTTLSGGTPNLSAAESMMRWFACGCARRVPCRQRACVCNSGDGAQEPVDPLAACRHYTGRVEGVRASNTRPSDQTRPLHRAAFHAWVHLGLAWCSTSQSIWSTVSPACFSAEPTICGTARTANLKISLPVMLMLLKLPLLEHATSHDGLLAAAASLLSICCAVKFLRNAHRPRTPSQRQASLRCDLSRDGRLLRRLRGCYPMAYIDAKVANRTVKECMGQQKMALERRTNPTLSWPTCSPRYGLRPSRGKPASVAKRPRERSHKCDSDGERVEAGRHDALVEVAVGAHVEAQHAAVALDRLEHHGAAAVAEQNARGAVT